MAKQRFLYLSRSDVESLGLPMDDAVQVVEGVLKEKGLGNVENPPKPGIHPKKDSFIHAMPAYIPKIRCAGIKWVSGYPDNPRRGLPYITGLIVLNEPETGLPIAVIDATWITTMRTGAATAISAKYLAREGSEVLAMIGCGVQSRSNLKALSLVCEDLKEVRAFDIVPSQLGAYVDEARTHYDYKVVGASSPREAIEGADIIVTSTPILSETKPVVEASWLKRGVLGCPLELDCYWRPDAIRVTEKVCTDDKTQLEYFKSLGFFGAVDQIYADLGELAAGTKPGRERDDEKIVIFNIGLALEDVALAKRVYDEAVKQEIGVLLPL